ncbi:ParM/StbA family protein [Roseomonas genomospecies 6]|uniref:ParM/StbA family protein n=1 Tax=Roseomonas genomospecies 6 TaxID=214106 RepID=A0A9W7NGH5_9PROT|nr:ParM/StbA family protein [Roseomonas genomospecies 6]KAA0677645.1 hypothetical protein DS843_22670 [Roseomonas genomospecies 6]
MSKQTAKKDVVAEAAGASLVDKPILAVVDDGYAQLKALADGRSVVLPTRFRAGPSGDVAMDGPGADVYEVDGEVFEAAGAVGRSESTDTDNFHYSTLNLVAVHHALHRLGLAGRTVDLVVGLPVKEFFRGDGSRNEENIARKIANLSKPVEAFCGLDKIEPVTISRVRVVAQAVSTWVDWAYDDAGALRVAKDTNIGVVDIGGRTTDVTVVLGGRTIDGRASGSVNLGALDMYARIERDIVSAYPRLASSMNLAKAEAAARTGSITAYGKPIDVSEIVAAAKDEIEKRIRRHLEKVLKDRAADLDCILLVGGSVNLFPGLGDLWPNVETLPNAEMSNANGMLKWGRAKG